MVRVSYPRRVPRGGHYPDCPLWTARRATCGHCRGTEMGERAERARERARSSNAYPAGGNYSSSARPVQDLTDLDAPERQAEERSCTGCYRPTDAPDGVCPRCRQ